MSASPRFDALYDLHVGHPDTNPFGFDRTREERDDLAAFAGPFDDEDDDR